MNSKPKLRTYQLYKGDFKTSNYVAKIINRYDRSLMAKFRLLQLRIETGRYTNLKLEEHICLICNMNQLEDEINFLCNCTKYVDIRKDLFDKAKSISYEFF